MTLKDLLENCVTVDRVDITGHIRIGQVGYEKSEAIEKFGDHKVVCWFPQYHTNLEITTLVIKIED